MRLAGGWSGAVEAAECGGGSAETAGEILRIAFLKKYGFRKTRGYVFQKRALAICPASRSPPTPTRLKPKPPPDPSGRHQESAMARLRSPRSTALRPLWCRNRDRISCWAEHFFSLERFAVGEQNPRKSVKGLFGAERYFDSSRLHSKLNCSVRLSQLDCCAASNPPVRKRA